MRQTVVVVDGEDRSSVSGRELLVAVTSHQLRSPVTAVRGFADTLADHWDALDEDSRREAVHVIRERAHELACVTEQLLSVTTAPAGAWQMSAFDLHEMLREVHGRLPERLRRRIRLAADTESAAAYADRASIAMVASELVTNAGKYASGEVEVDVREEPEAVVFRVIDRGGSDHGDSTDDSDDPWSAGQGAGSGVGLSLVREIVERQDGRVSLHRRTSGGTVAEVRLARADVVSGGGLSGDRGG